MKALNLNEKEQKQETFNEVEEKDELDSLIPAYYESNIEKNSITKIADEFKNKIKKIFSERGLLEFKSGNILATYSKSKTTSFDEDMLAELLKKANIEEDILKDIIKTREYVDYEVLENALYHGKFDPIVIKNARIEKEIYTLRIKKVKNKVENDE